MNLEQLKQIGKDVEARRAGCRHRVCVCAGASCISSGGGATLEAVRKAVAAQGLEKEVQVVPVGCLGACNQGPLVAVEPDDAVYQKVDAAQAERLVESHLKNGRPVAEMMLFSGEGGPEQPRASLLNFFKKQQKIVLENCGAINPEDIDEFIARDGYRALYNALINRTPEEVIAEVKQSGLRGRGGAGFPTGLKWEMVYKYVNEAKYVICNGDEGDPGAFMDRSTLEGDPHRVLEGMALAGFAVGAKRGFIYVRGEYPLAIKRLEIAIKQARAKGLLGKNIFETGFEFDVEIRIGAGAYVCGEETALLASIEGRRGHPKAKPPYPAENGLWAKPTLINNVETLANVAPIILNGGEWFSLLGTPKSTGTKVFALAGKIKNTGLIEVPLGMTLREIIYDIGGGIPGGKKFKAAQTGGPSGGCIPEPFLDTKVDYESLLTLGSIMGSGGLIVMDETSCMVDVAKYFMEFSLQESCGKCLPCRVGTKQMHSLLEKICRGGANMDDLAQLEELAGYVREASLCGLGLNAPNPLFSILRFFRAEYEAHILVKKCPAGVCKFGQAAVHSGRAV